jgi:hypothetical protein
MAQIRIRGLSGMIVTPVPPSKIRVYKINAVDPIPRPPAKIRIYEVDAVNILHGTPLLWYRQDGVWRRATQLPMIRLAGIWKQL